MAHIVSKAHAAFILSAYRLFDMSPKSIYFWTFTWKTCQPDWRYSMQWKGFSRELQDRYGGGIKGLRVAEVHPGEFSHGLHYHVLVNRRVCIQWVRRIASKYGMGRISVSKATWSDALYIAKYLSKENDLSPGMRRWGTIGGWKHTPVRNVECDSLYHRNLRYWQDKVSVEQLTTDCAHLIYRNTMLYGRVSNWPIQKLTYAGPDVKKRCSPNWYDASKFPMKRGQRRGMRIYNLKKVPYNVTDRKLDTSEYYRDEKGQIRAGI